MGLDDELSGCEKWIFWGVTLLTALPQLAVLKVANWASVYFTEELETLLDIERAKREEAAKLGIPHQGVRIYLTGKENVPTDRICSAEMGIYHILMSEKRVRRGLIRHELKHLQVGHPQRVFPEIPIPLVDRIFRMWVYLNCIEPPATFYATKEMLKDKFEEAYHQLGSYLDRKT